MRALISPLGRFAGQPAKLARLRLTAALLNAVLIAACSNPASQSLGLTAPVSDAARRAPARVAIVVKVPKRPKRRGPRPAFLSPSTASMTLGIAPVSQSGTKSFTLTMNLTPSSPGCTPSSTGTTCTTSLLLQPAQYTATIVTYDQTGAQGQRLSEAQQQPFTVVTGIANRLGFTLAGIPHALTVSAISSGISGTANAGFTVAGAVGLQFAIVAKDADSNSIVGPGAPLFQITPDDDTFAVAQPTAQQPNAFTVTPPQSMSAASTTFRIAPQTSAAVVCAESGASCTLDFSLTRSAATDDWFTFAHDMQRTAFQTQYTGVSTSTVSSLGLSWSKSLDGAIMASPLVYNGVVIVVTMAGSVYELDAQTGSQIWHTSLPVSMPSGANMAKFKSTPAIEGNQLFLGDQYEEIVSNPVFTYPSFPSDFYALDLTTGSVQWVKRLPGMIRSSPLAVGGRVYVGTSGGDPASCLQGGMQSLDESTGEVLWSWTVASVAGDGGSSWSPVTYDGQHVIFGTGNTCHKTYVNSDSVVALNLDGSYAWSFNPWSVTTDNWDQGGGISYVNGTYYFENKGGNLYALNAGHQQIFSVPINGINQVATPATDGSTIVVGSGLINNTAAPRTGKLPEAEYRLEVDRRGGTPRWQSPHGTFAGTTHSAMAAYDTAGNLMWTVPTTRLMYQYAAINNGVAFAGVDSTMGAYDLHTGKLLWSYAGATGDYFAAGPVIVPSGLYAGDSYGKVYAFRLNASPSSRRPHRARA